MSVLIAMVGQTLHIALMLLAAPILSGGVALLADRMAGRQGSPLAQPWRDMVRLLRKRPVHADCASSVSRFAPLLSVVLAFVCAALIPSFTLGMASAPLADLLSLAALFGAARIVLALAALDAGDAADGIAAAGVTSAAALAEPALLLAIFTLALLAGGGNLDLIVAARLDGSLLPGPAGALAIAAVALLGWEHAARPPMDASFSARDLALIQFAGQLRLLAWCDLIGALALPAGMAAAGAGPLAWATGLLAWAARLLLAAAIMAAVRALAQPLRRPILLAATLALCGAAAILAARVA